MPAQTSAGELSCCAYVAREPNTAGSLETVRLAVPEPGEVRVRVAATGVCHSDLHLLDGHLSDDNFPVVPGHEGAGIVEAVGEAVREWSEGDRVAFCFVPACGECAPCFSGQENRCEPGTRASFASTLLDGTTRVRDKHGVELKQFLAVGCFSEYTVVPESGLARLPADLPLWQAALIGCAVVTGVGAVRNAAAVDAGDSVCVVGCGGVGLQVIEAARLVGADPIVAVDVSAEKLEAARGLGATHGVLSDEERPGRAVRKLTGGGVDHAFEVVGRTATIRIAWDALRPGGQAVVVGLAPRGVDAVLPALEFLTAEKTIRGSFYGSGRPRAEIRELSQLAVDGQLDPGSTVSHHTRLAGIDSALQRMRDGVGSRTVVILDPDLAGAEACGRV
ncbi:MAG: alcohol dehydrogenase catalytic domain-containing protein [Gaiellaceae bacterium]